LQKIGCPSRGSQPGRNAPDIYLCGRGSSPPGNVCLLASGSRGHRMGTG
jgi:hypothetical protein